MVFDSLHKDVAMILARSRTPEGFNDSTTHASPMDSTFLKTHLGAIIGRSTDSGVHPCALALVFDGEREFYSGFFGRIDLNKPGAPERDTIFRMFSSSKPFTGFAAALCVERGLFSLESPVQDFLPGFAEVRVGQERRAPIRPVFVRDLLSMTSGLTYEFPWNDHPGLSTVAFANELGRRSLAFDPGDHWAYGYSADVMGAVIEVASGRRFGDFLREEIFEPLGMSDTAFFVPPEKRSRLCKPYWLNPETGRFVEHVERIDHLGVSDWDAPPAFESGGAGLFSTAADMQAWTRMLLAGGVWKGRRLISPATFRAMTSGLLTANQARTFTWDNCEGQQYGYFNHVQSGPGPQGLLSATGAFGWGGWMGTQSWTDPGHGIGGVFLVQTVGVSSQLANRVRNVAGAAAER